MVHTVVPACRQHLLEHIKPPVAGGISSYIYPYSARDHTRNVFKLNFFKQSLCALEQLEEKIYELVQLRIYLKLPDLHTRKLVEETIYSNRFDGIVVIEEPVGYILVEQQTKLRRPHDRRTYVETAEPGLVRVGLLVPERKELRTVLKVVVVLDVGVKVACRLQHERQILLPYVAPSQNHLAYVCAHFLFSV